MITIKPGDNKIVSNEIYRNTEYKLKLWCCEEFNVYLKRMISNAIRPMCTILIGIRATICDQTR